MGSLLLLVSVLLALLSHLEKVSQDAVMQASELVLLQTSGHVEDAVRDFLSPAPMALEDLKRHLRLNTLKTKDLEPSFYQTLHSNQRLSELTFTTKVSQLSLFRQPDGRLVTRQTHRNPNGTFSLRQRLRKPEQGYSEIAWSEVGRTPDPSEHLTFQTPLQFFEQGDSSPLWSDLSYSQLDDSLPESRRRVAVTVQGAVTGPQGEFLGIARIGLVTSQLDHAFDDVAQDLRGHPYSAFLCDARGRLITPVLPSHTPEPIQDDEGDLRIVPRQLDPLIATVLKKIPQTGQQTTLLHEQSSLACIRPLKLENTQDWWVGLVLPESALVGDLPSLRRQLLLSALLSGAAVTVLLAALLYGLRHQLARLQRTARQMKDFDFQAQPVSNSISEVAEVARSLEAAKTTLRAMVKYVPVELVRQLFEARLEPVLGSRPETVVLMFSDIAGFTTVAEKLTPDELSRCLGSYLTTMNQVIHANHGTVLERVGDALLSLWNAPIAIDKGEELACRTALMCQQAIDALPDAALLQTRFGIHRATVLVGHFGSPDRLNYGVLGDGVNLASRLEGLNKQYGTHIILSQAVRELLPSEFHLRHLDRVAVKGKSQGIEIYQLLVAASPFVESYERAWELYARQEFAAAFEILQLEDPPSAKLAARCRAYMANPPAADWDGTHQSKDK